MKKIRLNKEKAYLLIVTLFIWIMIITESQISELPIWGFGLKLGRMIIIILTFVHCLYFNNLKIHTKIVLFVYLFSASLIVNFAFFHGGTTLITMALLVIASKGVSLEKIFQFTLLNLVLSQLLVILFYLLGIISDNIDDRYVLNIWENESFKIVSRHSYGFLNANQLPTTFLFMTIIILCIRKNNIRMIELLVIEFINFFLYIFCNSRVAFILNTILVVSIVFILILPSRIPLTKIVMKSRFKYIFFTALTIFSFWTAYEHIDGYTYTKWDIILNFRPLNNYLVLNFYDGVSLFGKGDNSLTRQLLEKVLNVDYVVVDNGYIFLLIQRGWIIGVVLLASYTFLLCVASKRNNIYFFICLIVLGLENIINSHLTSYKILPILCVLANSSDDFLGIKYKVNSELKNMCLFR